MAEYIFKEAERSSYLTANTNEIITTLEKKERITRCRDCKHYKENRPIVSADDCRCKNPMWMNGGLWSIQVSPDGFCAWVEPKECE